MILPVEKEPLLNTDAVNPSFSFVTVNTISTSPEVSLLSVSSSSIIGNLVTKYLPMPVALGASPIKSVFVACPSIL